MSTIDFRFFRGDACPLKLFEFRYAVYVQEMGRRQVHACHDTRTIIDPLDEAGYQLVGFADGEIVVCVRANLLAEGPIGDYFELYGLDRLDPLAVARSAICTRLMVRSDLRSTDVTVKLFRHLYDFAIARNVESSFLDCNAHLVGFFRKFGFESVGSGSHNEYGDVSIMRLRHFEFDRLVRIGSPFAAQASRELSRRSGFQAGLAFEERQNLATALGHANRE